MKSLIIELLSALHQCPARSDFSSDLEHYKAVATWWKVKIAPVVKAIDHRMDQQQRQADAKARLSLEIAKVAPNRGGNLLGLAL